MCFYRVPVANSVPAVSIYTYLIISSIHHHSSIIIINIIIIIMKFIFLLYTTTIVVMLSEQWSLATSPDHSVSETPPPEEDRTLQDTQQPVVSESASSDTATCSNTSTCNSSAMSDLVASLDFQVEQQDDKEEEETSGFLGGLLSRLMNGFFKIFKRREDDGPKYTIRTESIIPLLDESSARFKSLSELITQESVTDAALSTTPDAVKMLYTAAADNMLLVTTVLDPIVENMRLHPTIDLRSMSCDFTRVLKMIQDVTVPNIQLMGKLLYTKSNDAQTKFTIDQYIDTSFTSLPSAALTTTSRSDNSTCLPRGRTPTESATDGRQIGPTQSPAAAPASVMFPTVSPVRQKILSENLIRDILEFLFDDGSVDVTPVGNIVRIILLILLIPAVVVVSTIVAILAAILAVIIGIPLIILDIFNITEGGSGASLFFILGIFAIILGPLITIVEILENIRELFTINQNTATSEATQDFFSTTFHPTTSRQANEVKRSLLDVLDSPLNTIKKVLGNKNSLSDTTDDEEEEMYCEMSALKCKTDAMNEILPL
jgi:hypothetical protein